MFFSALFFLPVPSQSDGHDRDPRIRYQAIPAEPKMHPSFLVTSAWSSPFTGPILCTLTVWSQLVSSWSPSGPLLRRGALAFSHRRVLGSPVRGALVAGGSVRSEHLAPRCSTDGAASSDRDVFAFVVSNDFKPLHGNTHPVGSRAIERTAVAVFRIPL